MSPNELRGLIAESIKTHCGDLPSCDEDVFQNDKLLIGAASVLADVCSVLKLYCHDNDCE